MALTSTDKAKIIDKYRKHDKDTSSPEVQVAIITAKLDYLKGHFASHSKDHHSRVGLMKMVGKRRRLLRYLQRSNESAYRTLITDLGIRK